MKILRSVRRFLRADDGPTSVEYAIMLSMLIAVAAGAVQALGSAAGGGFGRANGTLATSSSSTPSASSSSDPATLSTSTVSSATATRTVATKHGHAGRHHSH